MSKDSLLTIVEGMYLELYKAGLLTKEEAEEIIKKLKPALAETD